jgi:hypothetical protein
VQLFVFPGSLPLIFATNPADLMQRSEALGAVLSRRQKEKSIMTIAAEKKVASIFLELSWGSIEPLVRHEGNLAVSLYMPVRFQTKEDARESAVHLKHLLQKAETQVLACESVEAKARALLLGRLEQFATRETLPVTTPGIALFAADDFFRMFELPAQVAEQVTVGPHFEVKPLLGLMSVGPFYVLALSQKHVRLLRASTQGIEEVEVHDAPENLFATFENENFERQLQFHTASRPDMVNARISHGGGREPKDRILEFFRKVDRGVTETIQNHNIPLVLASVNYLRPLYHEVSAYPTLLKEAISGNVDHLKAEDLLAEGRAAIRRHLETENHIHFAGYQQLKGTERASGNSREIVASCDQGRVLFLFVPEGAVQWGRVEALGKVHLHAQCEAGDEELVNRAVLKTLSGGGQVRVLPPSEFDEGVRMAAIFRY